jgi:hypothetical protein
MKISETSPTPSQGVGADSTAIANPQDEAIQECATSWIVPRGSPTRDLPLLKYVEMDKFNQL